jgi:hypothetical protein
MLCSWTPLEYTYLNKSTHICVFSLKVRPKRGVVATDIENLADLDTICLILQRHV